ncbi:MAG: alpha-glucosidase/alpha-galactosidase [Candidatus Onthovivens sp.]|nr:alpha-glucosidase/alpha-galactosidase [Candidatus Onthovivens sp.]
MTKLCFIGAGSTIFAKNVLGDCILTPELGEFDIALFDIDPVRLDDSYQMVKNINKKYHGKANIKKYLNRKKALEGSTVVINAIQVGGFEATMVDFDIPKKYGLKQTIGDTLGVAGIFRGLRTIPVLESICKDMKEVCPNALFINYANPMAILTGYLQRYLWPNTVGLCHSVQHCVKGLLESVKMNDYIGKTKETIAGINHQAWLLKITDLNDNDLYPEIKRRILSGEYYETSKRDLVRQDMIFRFGYYITESSEHTSEYTPRYIKNAYPELIEKYQIPLDEYPRRCVKQINDWKEMREKLISHDIEHEKSKEFAAGIVNALVNNVPYIIHGNVLNKNLITNLPYDACVEVRCLVDREGIHPTHFGDLPEQCAAINRTNINVQNMTILAAHERKKSLVYMAAYLDPHTCSELSMDDIKNMCDELFEVHKKYMPEYK